MSIVDAVAKKLKCRPSMVFEIASMNLGYASDKQSAIWLSRYVETRFIAPEVTDWCLEQLHPRKEKAVTQEDM